MGRQTSRAVIKRRKMLAEKMKEDFDFHSVLDWYIEMFGLGQKSYERDRTVIYQQWKKSFVRDTEKELIELLQKIDADRKLARELGNAGAAIQANKLEAQLKGLLNKQGETTINIIDKQQNVIIDQIQNVIKLSSLEDLKKLLEENGKDDK